jgi:opacity protein-like surface antigen
MGRLADAANTYQRYLADPATGSERVAEVKDLLLRLDAQLTIVTVRVFPRGSDVSIDGGPFLAVGSSLFTRVRPGIHLVRLRNERANKQVSNNEASINGFEGEQKELPLAIQVEVTPDAPTPTAATPSTPAPTAPAALPDHLEGWLITGTQYSAGNGAGNERRVRAGYSGPEIAAVMPHHEEVFIRAHTPELSAHDTISSGVGAEMLIDPSHSGAALSIGLDYAANQRVDLELAYVRSKNNGGYAGVRYRLLTGRVRPYLAAGIPAFNYASAAVFGTRVGGGVELEINAHLSVNAELGYEHFFESKVSATEPYFTNLFVPIIGVIGRGW